MSTEVKYGGYILIVQFDCCLCFIFYSVELWKKGYIYYYPGSIQIREIGISDGVDHGFAFQNPVFLAFRLYFSTKVCVYI